MLIFSFCLVSASKTVEFVAEKAAENLGLPADEKGALSATLAQILTEKIPNLKNLNCGLVGIEPGQVAQEDHPVDHSATELKNLLCKLDSTERDFFQNAFSLAAQLQQEREKQKIKETAKQRLQERLETMLSGLDVDLQQTVLERLKHFQPSRQAGGEEDVDRMSGDEEDSADELVLSLPVPAESVLSPALSLRQTYKVAEKLFLEYPRTAPEVMGLKFLGCLIQLVTGPLSSRILKRTGTLSKKEKYVVAEFEVLADKAVLLKIKDRMKLVARSIKKLDQKFVDGFATIALTPEQRRQDVVYFVIRPLYEIFKALDKLHSIQSKSGDSKLHIPAFNNLRGAFQEAVSMIADSTLTSQEELDKWGVGKAVGISDEIAFFSNTSADLLEELIYQGADPSSIGCLACSIFSGRN